MDNQRGTINIDIHDRVAQAYYGELGESLQKETQHRMHWIRDNVEGDNILDVGCSQGIGPILLGRMGKKVLGVDISQQAVDEANKELQKEDHSVQENIQFIVSDFLALDINKQFDTITITEVLEHLYHPDTFIEKAYTLIKPKGRLIVTVPFGINDFPDHKKTYYYHDLYLMLYPYFKIENVSYMGRWIGFIAKKRNRIKDKLPTKFSRQTLKEVEDAFYTIERALVDSEQETSALLNDARAKFREVSAEKTQLLEKVQQIPELKNQLNDARAKFREVSAEKTQLLEKVQQIPELKNQLNDARAKFREVSAQKTKLLEKVQQIPELKAQLNDARAKFREVSAEKTQLLEKVQQIPELKNQLNDARAKFREVSAQKTELIDQLNDARAKFREVSAQKTELIGQLQQIPKLQREVENIKNSMSYKLGYLLLHEKKKLLNPKIFLKKTRTLFRIIQEKRKPVPQSPHHIGKITKAIAQKQENPVTHLSVLGWEEHIDPTKPVVIGIFDEFTHTCFQYQYNLIEPRPDNWQGLLEKYPPDFLFIESSWKGNYGSWQYRVAKYAHPPGNELEELVAVCKQKNIPTVFWNKEDPVHFDNFKHIAPMFDYVFTSAYEAIPRYRAISNAQVDVLQFAAEEHLHNPIRSTSRKNAVCFAGSYYANRFEERREDQLMLLRAARNFGLEIFDRNYNPDKTVRSDFEFPEEFDDNVIGSLPYDQLVGKYTQYKIFLNVNSIIDSKTMFSRRVFELLACGTPVVSTQALGIEETFGKDIVWTVKSENDAKEALHTLMHDQKEWRRRSLKGIRAVFNYHTYRHRTQQIANTIFDQPNTDTKTCLLFSIVKTQKELSRIVDIFSSMEVPNTELLYYAITDNQSLQGSPSNVHLIQNTNFAEAVEKIIEEHQPSYFSMFSPYAVYGKYFINDAIIALTYSNALISAKPLQAKDLYDYTHEISYDSIVINNQILPDSEHRLKKIIDLILIHENIQTFKENEVFCADAANFYENTELLKDDEYHTILSKVEV